MGLTQAGKGSKVSIQSLPCGVDDGRGEIKIGEGGSNILTNSRSIRATLYIEDEGQYTPGDDRGKNPFVCYPAFRKKETSCKEIRESITKLKALKGGFLLCSLALFKPSQVFFRHPPFDLSIAKNCTNLMRALE